MTPIYNTEESDLYFQKEHSSTNAENQQETRLETKILILKLLQLVLVRGVWSRPNVKIEDVEQSLSVQKKSGLSMSQ